MTPNQQKLVRGPRQLVPGPRSSPNLFSGGRSALIITTATAGLTGQSAMGILTSLGIVSGLVLSDNATRYMGRFVGSFILARVPVISVLAKVFFAAQRARQEDYIGAFLDLSSGFVSVFGLAGYATSVALDIGIIIRDIINHFQTTSDLRDMVITDKQQAEMIEILRPLVITALYNLIYNAPPLSLPNGQLVENGDLRELYKAARVDSPEGHALYEFIGAETMVSLGQLFEREQGNGLLQRGTARTEQNIREGFQRRMQSLSRQSAPPQSNKDVQEKSADADLIEDQEYEKIIFDADSIKFEGLADATKNASFSGGGFDGTDLGSMIRGDISGLGAGTFRHIPRQTDSRSRDERARIAMAFFISKGWTPMQAAAIVGNLMQESGLDPASHNEGEDARGIAQWRNPPPNRNVGRITNFRNWAGGREIFDSPLETQLEFVQHELMSTHREAAQYLRGATTLEQAVYAVDRFYERSALRHTSEREKFARQYLAANERQPQAQPQTNPAPSTGASLSQAGTNMVAADQQRVRVMQGLINSSMLQGTSEQSPTSMPPSNNPRGQNSPAEIPLRFRLQYNFNN